MKKKSLLFCLFAGLVYVTLSSNATGPITNANGIVIGSPGANKPSCADVGCHTGGATNTTIVDSVVVRDKVSGAAVESYTPGTTYAVSLNAHNTNLMNKFGYQAVVLDANGTNAGTLAATQTNTAVKTANGFKAVEHTAIITLPVAILRAEFDWVAPAQGTGAVTIYGMINAVDGLGTNSGDEVSPQITKTLAEGLNVGTIENNISLTAYPNPVNNLLKLKMENAAAGTYQIVAVDMSGRLVYNTEIKLGSASQEVYIRTKDWSAGVYQLTIMKDGESHSMSIARQ